MASEELLQCYNRGCGKKFSQSEAENDACQHHPGVPVFHDALKGWSCCKKRSTDFTEFLNIPGCSKGPHTNVKPVEQEKPKPDPGSIEEMIEQQSKPELIKRAEVQDRPSKAEPMVRLKSSVGATLKQALDKLLNEMTLHNSANKEGTNVEKGTSCKNNACKKTFEDESSNLEQCLYHPGGPIFHEGLKYWSCCQRKTTDFDNFLDQEGCETGHHVWFKEEENEKKVSCRYDWHQTGNFVTISMFSKVTVPEKSWVEANRVSMAINIIFDGGKSHFSKDITLHGVIDPEKSSVKMLGAKVEISMRKAEPGSWPTLELKDIPVGDGPDKEEQELDEELDVD